MNFGELLRSRKEALCITWMEMSERLGFKDTYIHKFTTCKKVPVTIETQTNWAKVLQVSLDVVKEAIRNTELVEPKERIYTEPDTSTFGGLVKEYREKRGISQKELADEIGVSIPYISRLECNNRWPSQKASIEKWSKILGLSYKDLVIKIAGERYNLGKKTEI
jgi:transcriptional regulator with XRE-family HTH domain